MKKHLLFVLFTITTLSAVSQSKIFLHTTRVSSEGRKTSYFTTKKISKEEERKTGQVIAKDKEREIQQGVPFYLSLIIDYPTFKDKLEKITSRKFDDKIFLIEYTFKDDTCTGNKEWDKRTIKDRKLFTNMDKKEIENRNEDVLILNFFEKGLVLKNSVNSRKEYFFTDEANFLKRTFFKTSVTCGSFAIIKPNGESLVRNGESSAWYLEQHLKPETWQLFF